METRRTRRSFTPEFKKQAAERVIIGKEKAQAVAQDLDISVVSLYQWIREYAKASESTDSLNVQYSKTEPEFQQEKLRILSSPEPRMYMMRSSSSFDPDTPEEKEEEPLELVKKEEEPLRAEKHSRLFYKHVRPASPQLSPFPKEELAPEVEGAVESRTVPEERNEVLSEPVPASEPAAVSEPDITPALETALETIAEQSAAPAPIGEAAPEQYRDKNFQKQRKQKQSAEKNQYRTEAEITPPVEEKPSRPVPTAAEGRSWKVKGALEQRPNYKEENEHYGYVDEFKVPANDLLEVWKILGIMQDKADKRAFVEMVHERQLNVPDEVLAEPRSATVPGPNVPNKPWLRKPRMHQVAEDFFQTTPEYAKSVYENYAGLDIRLGKNSDGTPILSSQERADGSKEITIDFSKFDRFVDDFYGDFVQDCKKVMMEMNPREYSSLNSFIRIPDEPLWNPKLWAGVRTFTWKNGETLSEAWIHYASNLRKNQRNKFFS